MGALAARDCLHGRRRRSRARARNAAGRPADRPSAAFPDPPPSVARRWVSTASRPSTCRWPAPARCSAWRWPDRLARDPRQYPGGGGREDVERGPEAADEPRDVSVLFGDGAGACLVSADAGLARIVDSALYTDGAFSEDLKLELDGPARDERPYRDPAGVAENSARDRDLLAKNSAHRAAEVGCFLMHQANQNLIVRVAEALGVEAEKFYSNISPLRQHVVGVHADRGSRVAARQSGFRARRRRWCSPPSAQASIGARCWQGRCPSASRFRPAGSRWAASRAATKRSRSIASGWMRSKWPSTRCAIAISRVLSATSSARRLTWNDPTESSRCNRSSR